MAEFKLGCPCGFLTDDPQAFLDHCLATQHVEFPFPCDADNVAVVSGEAVKELLEAFAAIQNHAAGHGPLPDGMEIRPVTEAEILMDDDLPDDVKQDLLSTFAGFQKRKES